MNVGRKEDEGELRYKGKLVQKVMLLGLFLSKSLQYNLLVIVIYSINLCLN